MEGFWKKFYSHFNEADPFYAVGRGDEGMAYGSLIEWIVTNPSPEFDPSNLTALAASEKFKEAFFKNVVDLWGEQEAITWFVENVLAGGAVYKPVSKGYLRKIRAEKPSKNEVNLKMTNEQFKWTIHETAEAVKKKKVVVDEEPEGNEGL